MKIIVNMNNNKIFTRQQILIKFNSNKNAFDMPEKKEIV